MKRKRIVIGFICSVLSMSILLTSCGASQNASTASASPTVTASSDIASPSASSTSSDTGTTSSDASATRIIQDCDGNDVVIPANVTKVAPMLPAFSQTTEMLTMGGDYISAAANKGITNYFKQVFPNYVKSNPKNYEATSVEDLIASGTQVCFGPSTNGASTLVSDDQKQQLSKAGIAYVPVNNVKDIDGMCQSITIIGNIIGGDAIAKAAEFCKYYKGNIQLAKDTSSDIKDSDKVTIMVLRVAGNGYTTINQTDICNSYIEAAGGINVAHDYTGPASTTAFAVGTEQVIKWNPQIIITSDLKSKDTIMKDPALAGVDAVKNGKVFVTPKGVYLWSVRSSEGAMMPLWLGTIMYPDKFSNVDMTKVVTDFFKNYYNYDLSSDEVTAILSGHMGANGIIK